MERSPIKEKLPRMSGYRYTVLRPGGNDTALIEAKDMMADQKIDISKQMMKFYPNVEQVGFVDLDPVRPKLAMAGGEFCGNATRSTAYLASQGQVNMVNISVSGVNNPLLAGVDELGEAFAQMPIYQDPEKIKPVPREDNSWIVEMEGITHLVTFDTKNIDGLDRKEIEQIARGRIKELGLETYPAAGVIYATKTNKGFEIKPIVWVKNTNDLFYETACGSGTTALGLVLARIQGSNVDVPVIQPSGLPIGIKVEFDGNRFKTAQIKGPVEVLYQGSLEQTKKGNVIIEQINTREQMEKSFLLGLAGLYQQIFSQPPYEELFTDNEIENVFDDYLKQGKLFIARTVDQVVGFGAALPLASAPEIAEAVNIFGFDPNQTWYMADLGVTESYRRIGLGRKLIEARLNSFSPGSTVIMRTQKNNRDSQSLYSALGFSIVPSFTQNVEQMRTDGQIKSDQRIYMQKKL